MGVSRLACLVFAAATSTTSVFQHDLHVRAALDLPPVSAPLPTPLPSPPTAANHRLGASVMEALRSIRGATATNFYTTLFNALQIFYCDRLNANVPHTPLDEVNAVWTPTLAAAHPSSVPPYVRLVPKSDPTAFKDTAGNCIAAPHASASIKALYDAGYCEVAPNCYWTGIPKQTILLFSSAFCHDADPRNTTSSTADRAPIYATVQTTSPAGAVSLAAATATVTAWARGLALTVAPAIVFAVIGLLALLLFLAIRCCCNSCGGRSPRADGYTTAQLVVPIATFALFGIALVTLAVFALLYSKAMVASSDTLLANVAAFVESLNQWLHAAEAPLQQLGATVDASADTIAAALATSDFIPTGLDTLVAQLDTIAQQLAGPVALPLGCNATVDAICMPCTICADMFTQATSARDQVQAVATQGRAQLTSAKQTINATLNDARTTAHSATDTGLSAFDGISPVLNSASTTISSAQATWQSQTLVRSAGVLALFALSLVVLVIGVLGIVVGLTPANYLAVILHLGYVVGFLALVFLFVVAAVTLAASMLVSDGCQLSTVLANDWAPVLGATEGAALNACFQHTSLLDALDLGDAVASANLSVPPSNLAQLLQLDPLDAFASGVVGANTTTATFAIASDAAATSLAMLNVFTNVAHNNVSNSNNCSVHDGAYAIPSIHSPWLANGDADPHVSNPASYVALRYLPWRAACAAVVPRGACAHNAPCTYDAFVVELYTNTSALVNVTTDAAAFVASIQASVAAMQATTASLEANVTALARTVDTTSASLQVALQTEMQAFQTALNCSFVANDFTTLHDALCDDLTPTLALVSLCLFLAGVAMLPINIALILLVKRLRAPEVPQTAAPFGMRSKTDLVKLT
ncbi:Aste57867_18824 [Aphanomyces stellatus]|uniref:Aste57867_18824 protein n=1 Tax=Aphanomyces stellatus TaxID=120398 RepID=A0A485LCK3_9STRA|nr:hypothetical protein As57867_018760 [Aphanomyces stellatus]VFT95558.1 Aste57867_18824 [Aphanomyces stellatus]